MIRPCHAAALLALACSGCVRPPTPAGPRPAPSSIAVFPPNNLTGDILLVAGASALEKYALHTERVTVPDVLESEARLQLARQGFSVTAPEAVDAATGGSAPAGAAEAATTAARGGLEGAVLYVEVRRWEPDAPFHPAFVITALDAALVDIATGRTLWKANHPSRPIPTPGVVVLGDAYVIAARAAMQQLLAPLTAEHAAP